jgi:hypothetical protein
MLKCRLSTDIIRWLLMVTMFYQIWLRNLGTMIASYVNEIATGIAR